MAWNCKLRACAQLGRVAISQLHLRSRSTPRSRGFTQSRVDLPSEVHWTYVRKCKTARGLTPECGPLIKCHPRGEARLQLGARSYLSAAFNTHPCPHTFNTFGQCFSTPPFSFSSRWRPPGSATFSRQRGVTGAQRAVTTGRGLRRTQARSRSSRSASWLCTASSPAQTGSKGPIFSASVSPTRPVAPGACSRASAADHDEYGIDLHTIAMLFVVGFVSAGLTAPYVGLL